MHKVLSVFIPIISCALLFFSTHSAASDQSAADGKPQFPSFTSPDTSPDFSGIVVSSRDLPVVGATVFLISTDAIDMTPITATDVYAEPFVADAYDEPLEDALRRHGDVFKQAKTSATGRFQIFDVPDGKYYIYADVDENDDSHLPGGDLSRIAHTADELRGMSMKIRLSSRPSEEAHYVGSTECLDCHEEHESWNQTGHKLGWSVPGKPGPLQDFSKFPEWFKAMDSWTITDDYKQGTRLEIGDYRPKASGAVKFDVREFQDSRLPIDKVFADVYLWREGADGPFYITMENRLNPDDPNSPSHMQVEMVYGGAVHRQRYIVSVPGELAERQGFYTLLQFNPDGRDQRLNISRRVWRDYKFSYWWGSGADETYGTEDDVIKAPAVNENTIQAMCAACHVTGYERYVDETTGQALVRGVDDPNGSFNIDDDPAMDEVNVGCESCHGPGSEHVENVGLGDSFPYSTVNPAFLAVERETAMCGRCHDRRKGPGGPTLGYTQPIDADGKMMMPGLSRHEMITTYSVTRGPIPGRQIWQDDVHSRNPHQQYSDYMKSGMYRNDRMMVGCADCHNMHGGTGFRRSLIANPDDAQSDLCQSCHVVDINDHMAHNLGNVMKGAAGTRCVDCHMPGTMVYGGDAGAYGRMIKPPHYETASAEERYAYLEGHINSHVFDVPRKSNVGVRGVLPGKAMPIPFTNSCGSCHDVSELPYK